MPASDIAEVLGSVLGEANERVRQNSEEQKKIRDQNVDFYYQVLLNPDTPSQKAEEAAKEIAKLQQLKFPKGANPLEMVTGLLNTFRGMLGKKQLPSLQGGQPQAGGKTTNLTGDGQDTLQPQSNVRQIGGRQYSGQLPPLNTKVLASPEESGAAAKARSRSEHGGDATFEMTEYRKGLKEAVPSITEEQLDKAVETKFGAIPKPTSTGHTFTKKGTVSGKEIPANSTDVLDNPIDKARQYDVLQNAAGDKEYIPSQGKHQIRTLADETGKPADFLVDLNDLTKLIKIGAKPEQAEYKVFTDPDTQEQYAKPVPRYVIKGGSKGSQSSDVTQPSKRTFPALHGAPSASNGHSKKTLTPLQSPQESVSRLDKLGKESSGDYVKGKGISLGKKDTTTARAKAEQAVVVIRQGEDLIKQIEAGREALGPWKGRISGFEVGLGSADEKVRGLYTALESFANLQPALHGSRGIGMVKEFKSASGRLADDPDSAIAAIRSLMNTARHFAEVGGEGNNVSSSTLNPNAEKEAQAYLDSLKKK